MSANGSSQVQNAVVEALLRQTIQNSLPVALRRSTHWEYPTDPQQYFVTTIGRYDSKFLAVAGVWNVRNSKEKSVVISTDTGASAVEVLQALRLKLDKDVQKSTAEFIVQQNNRHVTKGGYLGPGERITSRTLEYAEWVETWTT